MADVILLSTADWDHPLWTNKQHTAVSLADQGHRVLYIDSLGVRSVRADRADGGRILRRLHRSLWPLRRVHDSIWVLSPLVLPGRTQGMTGRLNRWSLNLALFWADCCLDLRTPLLWTFNPNTRSYLKLGRFHATLYHCVDRIQAQPGMPAAALAAAECDLCAAVNAVFTTAPELQNSLAPLNAGTHLFGNVADARHFGTALARQGSRPADLPDIHGPCLMFIGAIDAYKLDLVMLEALAAQSPQWSFVLIGPIGETDPSTDASGLRSLSNVHWLGPRPYNDLPSYLACADVALLPLQLNDYTRHMYPMKFFEYLAAGCPVVATAIPSLRDQDDVAWLCPPQARAFRQAIAAVLQGQGPPQAERLARAAQCTYERRTAAMLHCLERHGLMPADPAPPQAMPYHRLRRQLHPSCFGARFGVLLVGCLERLRLQRFSQPLLDRLSRRWPRNTTWLAAASDRALAQGDNRRGTALIERIWQLDGEAEVLHQLLFRRGSRPGDRGDQQAMFDTLACSDVLPFHFTAYCRVVGTYRAIDQKQPLIIRRCLEDLDGIITRLSNDPDTVQCLRPNRENRSKLLISAHLTRLRALMVLGDSAALDAAALALMRCVSSYDPFRLDRTTALRMTRNLMRCLALAAVMAWHARDSRRFDAVVDAVQRLRDACLDQRFDPIAQRTQEDHRGFAALMLERLQPCRWSAEASVCRPEAEAFVEPILLVYFPVLRRDRAEKAQRFLASLSGSSQS